MVEYRRSIRFLALAVICLAIVPIRQSCRAVAADESTDAPGASSPKPIVVIDDIAYRSGSSRAWRLDLAMPENFGEQKRPALVIVHGGGWSAGDKRDRPFRSMLLDYALKGYVTISVNYRLTREAPLPACIEDVKCAVRWLKAHAEQYRVDTDRIVAYGHSAGAHLALMLGMAGPDAGLEGDGGWNDYSSNVTAVVGGSPPTSLPARFGDPVKYSPSTYVSAETLPILLIQGTADRIVRVETTDDFVEKLKQAGAKDVTYVRIEGGDHGVAYDSFLDRSTAAMNEFFERTLAKPAN
ncbi:MAG: alpha/beta hydrolase [Sedimentisphaerales bacterium]|nr:alpha/beta hydrolase [Sedimentisphaerales bacterium]